MSPTTILWRIATDILDEFRNGRRLRLNLVAVVLLPSDLAPKSDVKVARYQCGGSM